MKEFYPVALDSVLSATYILNKMLDKDLNMILRVLMQILVIIELHSRFIEYLAIEADDEFDSVLVCNIVIGFSLSA